jgi:hypothetical protein
VFFVGFLAVEALLLDGFFAAVAFDVVRLDDDARTLLDFLAPLLDALAVDLDVDAFAERDERLLDDLRLLRPRAERERAARSRPFHPTALSARNDAGIARTSP